MRTIDGQMFKMMVISASNNLYNHYPEVDALNVFPVPDGDTGMNMNLTLTSGAKEVQNRSDNDIYSIAKTFSRGLLMGARGNSGVITSQIFRGFTDSLQNKSQIDAVGLAEAFDSGRKVAYVESGVGESLWENEKSLLLDYINGKEVDKKDKEDFDQKLNLSFYNQYLIYNFTARINAQINYKL